MKRRVRVTLPKAEKGSEVGFNWNQLPWPGMAGKMSMPDVSVKSTLQSVDKKYANLEAEKGEIAMLPTKNGIPSTYKIGGKRHSEGGTPLNLPANSFIFSDTAKMKIKDPVILAQFGMSAKSGGYTPADIAKKYDINPYKKILADPDTDDLQRSTAEMMISNFNMKLAKLALIQESMKGFDQGIPAIAIPYIEAQEINPADFIHMSPQADQPDVDDTEMSRYGGTLHARNGAQVPAKRKVRVILPKMKDGGNKMTPDAQLALIKERFSNPKIQQALYDKTIAAANDPKNRGKDMGFTVDELQAMTPAQLTDQFVEMQTRNIKADELMTKGGYDNYFNQYDQSGKRVKGSKSPYASLDEVFDATGIGRPKDKKTSAMQQATYLGYRDLLDDARTGKIKDADINTGLKPFRIKQKGVQDEKHGIDPEDDISKIDTWYTNTTAGQIAGIIDEDEPIKPADPIKEPAVINTPGITQASHLQEPVQDFGAPWWLQDQVKIGHAARNLAGIKKYFPWQATPSVFTPGVTFESPERALAANAEQSNIAANTLAQFTGPQSFNARFNQIQGQGFKNAADTLAQVHNRNIGISNMQEAQNANIMNRASENRANLSTSLWDKYQATNQNFDAAKSQARDALVSAYVQGQTNRANTYNMNTLFPEFAVNPANAGMVYNKATRDLKPSFNKAKTFTDTYNDLLRENPTLKDKPDKAADIAMKLMGIQPTPTDYDSYTDYKKRQGVIPGYQDQSET